MTLTRSYQDKPWLNAYHQGVPESIKFEETLLHQFLEIHARRIPDQTALIFQGYRMSFKAFNDTADAFAAFLQNQGVKKGDAVAILLPNVIPCPVAFYAIMKLGAVAVMNSPRYSDPELLHQLNDSQSTHLITLDLLADRMVALRPQTRIQSIVVTSMGDYLPFPKNIFFPLVGRRKGLTPRVQPAKDLYFWKAVVQEYKGTRPVPVPGGLTFEDTALIQYTGGTTGVAKGAILTHGNLSKQTQQINAWLPMFQDNPDEIMLGAIPFYHVMGLTVSMNFAVAKGWTNILVPTPKPHSLLGAMEEFRPTITPLVPGMFIGVLNHPETGQADLSSIKACVSGAAPLPLDVIRGFEKKTGALIIEAFGMTEASPATHVNPFSRGKRKVGSIGVPLPDTDCRILDLDDPQKEMPVGHPGQMVIKGPQVMQGYKNMAGKTQKTIVNGWLHTGDIALMDEDGYFFIVDRLKDMIISGGNNVYPRDIDEVLITHPKVMEACAVGIPHPIRGEQIKAFVVPAPGQPPSKEELFSYCREKLARYKLPTQIEFIDDLPKTNVGKVSRKDLRAMEMAKTARRKAS